MLIDSATVEPYAVRQLRMNVYDKNGSTVKFKPVNSEDFILCTISFYSLFLNCIVTIVAIHSRRKAYSE